MGLDLPAMRWAVVSMPPFCLVECAFSQGDYYSYFRRGQGKNKHPPSWRELAASLCWEPCSSYLGNGFMSVGLQRCDSYLAAIIVSMTPFCIALFNRLLSATGYR
jgi:hypothetical protein